MKNIFKIRCTRAWNFTLIPFPEGFTPASNATIVPHKYRRNHYNITKNGDPSIIIMQYFDCLGVKYQRHAIFISIEGDD